MKSFIKLSFIGAATVAFVAFTSPGKDKKPKYIDLW